MFKVDVTEKDGYVTIILKRGNQEEQIIKLTVPEFTAFREKIDIPTLEEMAAMERYYQENRKAMEDGIL